MILLFILLALTPNIKGTAIWFIGLFIILIPKLKTIKIIRIWVFAGIILGIFHLILGSSLIHTLETILKLWCYGMICIGVMLWTDKNDWAQLLDKWRPGGSMILDLTPILAKKLKENISILAERLAALKYGEMRTFHQKITSYIKAGILVFPYWLAYSTSLELQISQNNNLE